MRERGDGGGIVVEFQVISIKAGSVGGDFEEVDGVFWRLI